MSTFEEDLALMHRALNKAEVEEKALQQAIRDANKYIDHLIRLHSLVTGQPADDKEWQKSIDARLTRLEEAIRERKEKGSKEA